MNELINFLTSKEIIIVYIVAGCACLLCLIIYIVEKNNEKFRRRHNTKELNKLVEMVKEKVDDVSQEIEEVYEEPVLQIMEEEPTEVVELLEDTVEEKENIVVVPAEARQEVQTSTVSPIISEEMKSELIVIEDEKNENVKQSTSEPEILEEVEELQYTSIEPDQATAKLELQKITEELKKQEQQEVENITLTNYESEQEENAIISLDELIKKGKEMYESNEVTQYADEGNEPISLNELAGLRNKEEYAEPFIISDVVSNEVLEEETLESEIEVAPVTIEEQVRAAEKENVRIENDVVVQTEVKNEAKKFKSSPIISPIYGIENTESVNDLELENTANYEKLDEEIKKTNEFIMSLKELQGKLN